MGCMFSPSRLRQALCNVAALNLKHSADIYIYINKYECIDIHLRICRLCIQILRVCICIYVHTSMYVYVYIYTHIDIYIYTYTGVYISTRKIYVYMYTYTHVYVYVYSVHMFLSLEACIWILDESGMSISTFKSTSCKLKKKAQSRAAAQFLLLMPTSRFQPPKQEPSQDLDGLYVCPSLYTFICIYTYIYICVNLYIYI